MPPARRLSLGAFLRASGRCERSDPCTAWRSVVVCVGQTEAMAAAVMAVVDRTDNLMSSMLAGPSVLDRLDFAGPSNRMNRLVADMNRRFEHLTSPDYFETLEEKDVQVKNDLRYNEYLLILHSH